MNRQSLENCNFLPIVPYSAQGLLSSLPPPPDGYTGWPWTEETPPLPPIMLDGKPWPKISIVTPSYNQGQFIEETIRSILLQNYPNLEYIIIDGASTDNSVDIIKKYERWITYWVTEKDRGQAQAINKGIYRASGDIFNWINSDDLLLPKVLRLVAEVSGQTATKKIICGDIINFIDLEQGRKTEETYGVYNYSVDVFRFFWKLKIGAYQYQPTGTFLPLDYIKTYGGFNENYHYCFDWDMMCRITPFLGVHYLNLPVAKCRVHDQSKTVAQADRFVEEKFRSCEAYAKVDQDTYNRFLRQRSIAFACRDIGPILDNSSNKLRIFYQLMKLAWNNPSYLTTRPLWGAFRQIWR